MKKSTRVLGTVILSLAGLLILSIITARLYINRFIDKPLLSQEGGDEAQNSYGFQGFTQVEIFGPWSVEILQDEEYSIETERPENSKVKVELQEGGTLLSIQNDFLEPETPRNKWPSIRITMPTLEEISVRGSVETSFTGFIGDALKVTMEGTGSVMGEDSQYEKLKILCSGVGTIDLSATKSRDAEVDFSGVGKILLNMDGGVLSGSVTGVGSVEYEGTVSLQDMRVNSLLGSVRKR